MPRRGGNARGIAFARTSPADIRIQPDARWRGPRAVA